MQNINGNLYDNNNNIKIYHKGYETCDASHTFGPFVRDHYLLHIVMLGEGSFNNGTHYNLSSGEGFLIRPNETTTYKADDNNPWTYYWVGFHCRDIENIMSSLNFPDVFKVSERTMEIIKSIVDISYDERLNDYFNEGMIKQLLGSIQMDISASEVIKIKDKNMSIAKDYLEMNYALIQSLQEVADKCQCHLEYLSRKFKNHYNISLKEYLIQTRLFHAKQLLRYSNASIDEISQAVGYPDQFYFSKLFKKKNGLSPSQYRKK